jgi:uracil-DNA glycosylase
MPVSMTKILRHQKRLQQCTLCPSMIGPVIIGTAVNSSVYLIGQAPGAREGAIGRPFAWTAGKTLFEWFTRIGLDEQHFRNKVYMAAVCRCFPGKNKKGGDRVPNREEIINCSRWLHAEINLLKPSLIIPVGKLAIQQMIHVNRLTEVIGNLHRVSLAGITTEAIPLPHPSGASTWHRTEPGKSLLEQALQRIQSHTAWTQLCREVR